MCIRDSYVNMEGYLVGKRVLILGSGDIGLIMARRMTLEAVSYTHLDVYKRQVPGWMCRTGSAAVWCWP